ncbi:TPA: DUF2388 domain-containing protein [Pseudomonas putida]|nr:DUF2388 domain-containing protein [Pseudomonas putida]
MDGKGNSVDHFTLGSSLLSVGLSGTTSHPLQAFKAARDDALAFVGSAGRYRGVRLEQAFQTYRQVHPYADVSDEQLALAIASLQ